MIAFAKFLHLVGLLCWSAALLGLPLLLHHYRRARTQSDFTEYRLITHYGYIAFASPAAVLAISAGTAMIFLADVHDPWLLIKLAFVAGMALVHAWLGHLILKSGETGGRYRMPQPLIALALAIPQIGIVLWLALAKPDLGWLARLLPAVALEPQGGSL